MACISLVSILLWRGHVVGYSHRELHLSEDSSWCASSFCLRRSKEAQWGSFGSDEGIRDGSALVFSEPKTQCKWWHQRKRCLWKPTVMVNTSCKLDNASIRRQVSKHTCGGGVVWVRLVSGPACRGISPSAEVGGPTHCGSHIPLDGILNRIKQWKLGKHVLLILCLLTGEMRSLVWNSCCIDFSSVSPIYPGPWAEANLPSLELPYQGLDSKLKRNWDVNPWAIVCV